MQRLKPTLPGASSALFFVFSRLSGFSEYFLNQSGEIKSSNMPKKGIELIFNISG
jgi:hypothetical protein